MVYLPQDPNTPQTSKVAMANQQGTQAAALAGAGIATPNNSYAGVSITKANLANQTPRNITTQAPIPTAPYSPTPDQTGSDYNGGAYVGTQTKAQMQGAGANPSATDIAYDSNLTNIQNAIGQYIPGNPGYSASASEIADQNFFKTYGYHDPRLLSAANSLANENVYNLQKATLDSHYQALVNSAAANGSKVSPSDAAQYQSDLAALNTNRAAATAQQQNTQKNNLDASILGAAGAAGGSNGAISGNSSTPSSMPVATAPGAAPPGGTPPPLGGTPYTDNSNPTPPSSGGSSGTSSGNGATTGIGTSGTGTGAGGGASGVNLSPTGNTNGVPGFQPPSYTSSVPGLDPSFMDALSKSFQPALDKLNGLANSAYATYEQQSANANAMGGQGGLYETQRDAQIKMAQWALGNQSSVIDAADSAARARAANVQSQQLAAQTQANAVAQAQLVHAESVQRFQNIDTERQMRYLGSAYGLDASSNGLAYMAEQTQKGTEAINYLFIQQANLSQDNANQVMKIIQDYGDGMKGLDIQKLQEYQAAYSNYGAAVQSAQKDYLTSEQDLYKQNHDDLTNLYKNYQDTDYKYADLYGQMNGKMMDAATEIMKFQAGIMTIGPKDTDAKLTSIKGLMQQDTVYQQAIGTMQSFKGVQSALASLQAMKPGDPPNLAAKTALLSFFNDVNTGKYGADAQSTINGAMKNVPMLGSLLAMAADPTTADLKGITSANYQQFADVAAQISGIATQKAAERIASYVSDIDSFNSTGHVISPLDPKLIIPGDFPASSDLTSKINAILTGEGEQPIDTGTGGGGGGGGTLSSLGPNATVRQFFNVYAPSSDNNTPSSYAADVATKLGVTSDTPLGQLSGKVPQMADAIIAHEGVNPRFTPNNNPGNLNFAGQPGAVMGEGGFAKFPTPEAGRQALEAQITAAIQGSSQIASK